MKLAHGEPWRSGKVRSAVNAILANLLKKISERRANDAESMRLFKDLSATHDATAEDNLLGRDLVDTSSFGDCKEIYIPLCYCFIVYSKAHSCPILDILIPHPTFLYLRSRLILSTAFTQRIHLVQQAPLRSSLQQLNNDAHIRIKALPTFYH